MPKFIKKEKSKCPITRVHQEEMQSSKTETYTGDVITESGSMEKTLKPRKVDGLSDTSEIRPC